MKRQIDVIRDEKASCVYLEELSKTRKANQYAKREYKYLVPIELIDDIRNEMKPYVHLDKFSDLRKEKQYTVRSIYYDTTKLCCYREKAEGLRIKKKFRIRGYNSEKENSIVFLEIKRKYENFVAKNRAPLRWAQMKTLFSDQRFGTKEIPFEQNSEEEKNARRFLCNYYHKKLLPTVLVSYEREAFYSKFDATFRITFDKSIRSLLYPSLEFLYVDEAKYVMPRHFILEVKFYRGFPYWVRSLITRYEMLRLSLSKYTICIDSHRILGKSCRRVSDIIPFYGSQNNRGGMRHA